MAAIVGAPACKRNPLLTRMVNYDANMNIVNNVSVDQKVLFPTTNSGYGIGGDDSYCTEETPLRPISEYGKTKVEIEQAFLDRGNAVTFRLATVFGMSPRMRMDLIVNDFVYQAVTNKILTIFQADFRRTFIHVRDMARSYLFALDHFDKMIDEVYNVGDNSQNFSKEQICFIFYSYCSYY